jgi:hypothetical protein
MTPYVMRTSSAPIFRSEDADRSRPQTMTVQPTDHPDFAAMRTSLRELNDRSTSRSLSCPNPDCEGTLRALGGLLSCSQCSASR